MKQPDKADNPCMNPTPKRLLGLAIAILFLPTAEAGAGLIELIETYSGGSLTLSIEGNALRLTDNAGGELALRVLSTMASGSTTAEDLGLAGVWPALTVLGVPLQDDILLSTTRLDSLLGGAGISTSGNVLRDIDIRDSTGIAWSFDLDSVEVIGGPVPEPSTFILSFCCALSLLSRRKWAV